MEWISVDDKLPEKNKKVIGWDHYMGICVASYDENWFNEYPCIDGYDIECLITKITHWAFISDPPPTTSNKQYQDIDKPTSDI